MIRRTVIGLALIAGTVVAWPGASAVAQGAAQVPDMTGQWRLDPKRSDVMGGAGGGEEPGGPRGERLGGRPGGMGGPGGPGGRRGMGGPGGVGRAGGEGARGPRPEGAARRPARLPDLMHVTHTDQLVSFEDSTGTVLQEITTLGGAKDDLAHAPGATVLSGGWKGDTLVVQRQGPRGGKVTESIRLEADGSLLVVRTRIEGSEDMPAREFKRVYARVTE